MAPHSGGGHSSGGHPQREDSSSGRDGEQRCANCDSTESWGWFDGSASGKLLCGTCYQYRNRTGIDRPAELVAAHRQAQAEGCPQAWRHHASTPAGGGQPAAAPVQHAAEQGEQDGGYQLRRQQGADPKVKEQRQPQKLPKSPAAHERRQVAQAQGRRCFQCGSRSPGNFAAASWRRHPVTGQEWMCDSCARCARRAIQAQQRQEQQKWQQRQRQQPQQESAPQPAAKRQRREQRPAVPTGAVTTRPGGTGSGGGGTGPATVPRVAPPAASGHAAQQPSGQQPQQQPQDLFSLLLGAAEQAAAAASGLTADLSASFSALLDTLPPDQQAAKVRGEGGAPACDLCAAGAATGAPNRQTPALCAVCRRRACGCW